MNRRSVIAALFVGSCAAIVKASQENLTFRTGQRWKEMEEAWRHWTVTVPKTLTVIDPDTNEKIDLTAAEIMKALRGDR